MELQIDQLELRYSRLRIFDSVRRGRLLSSIADQGQTSPVLVLPIEDGRFVLLDGYMRISVLLDLAKDLVSALELSMPEADALVFVHRFDVAARHTALEEAWLVAELVARHHLSLHLVGLRLGRSTSWVSRRLALARNLSEVATEAIQAGRIPAHAAAKYLVPLARANSAQCTTLVKNLGKERLSDRQVERLYIAWKRADDVGKERIVAQPMLALAASEEVFGPIVLGEPFDLLLSDIDAWVGVGRRARRRLEEGDVQVPEPRKQRVRAARDEAKSVASSLLASLEALCTT